MPKNKIYGFLREEMLELFAVLGLDECHITRKYLLDRADISEGSVIVIATPYVTEDFGRGNVSEYAKSRDYHLFFDQLFSKVLPKLRAAFPENKFVGFADHSPINEKHAAALSGIGVIGKNTLLLTEKYSSFVFLGEIITDLRLESDADSIRSCHNCGRCSNACPVGADPSSRCLSAITQKKGDLDSDEKKLIISSASVWGCDACQTVCPYTEKALRERTIYTPVPFFKEARIHTLSKKLIEEMSDEEFSSRAYSWRGRSVILRNLDLLEG